MKEFLKRTWQYFIFIPIIAIVIIGIFLNLPNGEKELLLSAGDINLNVGEKVLVNYDISIKEAECEITTENKDIAIVNGDEVLGVNVGQTKLILTATFRNTIAVEEINVNVLSVEDSGEQDNVDSDLSEDNSNGDTNGDNIDNEGNNEEDNNSSEDDKEDNSNDSQNDEDILDAEISIKYIFEEVDSLSIDLNSSITIEITANYDFDLIYPQEVKVEKLEQIPNNYKVTGKVLGEYELQIKCGNEIKTIQIIVE